jgi:hypothetical protein
MQMPLRTVTLAHVPKGKTVHLGQQWLTVGGRPRPGFIQLMPEKAKPFHVRAKTKVRVLENGKVR